MRDAILKGELGAGDRLIETEVASQLEVSRTPVREAMRMLEKEGLVEYAPRRGIFVSAFTRQDIIEVYSVRAALEALAVSFSVTNITPAEVQQLKDTVAEMRDYTDSGNIGALCQSAKRYNDILVESCRASRLIGLISTYQGYLSRFRAVTLGGKERSLQALREHEEIILAVERKDAAKAQELVKEHLMGALAEHLRHLDKTS